jgi:uncharacterized protein (DUF2141 family)
MHISKITLQVLIILFISTLARSNETVSIKGTILVNEIGTLYIYLVDKKQFKIPFSGIQKKVVRITQKNKAHKIQFAFKGIPPNIYGVRAFLDTNHNKKLDRGLFGPKEPWGMSFHGKRSFGIPSFDDISIDARNSNQKISFTVK